MYGDNNKEIKKSFPDRSIYSIEKRKGLNKKLLLSDENLRVSIEKRQRGEEDLQNLWNQ